MRRRDYSALAQPPHDCARQRLEGKGVGDVADSPSPPHPRHRELLGQELRRRSFPSDSGGHEIALGAIAKMDLYLGEHDLAVAGNLCCVGDAHARDDLVFRREPTPTLEIGRKEVVQNCRGVAFAEKLAQAFAHYQGLEFRQLLGRLVAPARRCFAGGLELEPVEGVGGEGQKVIQLADRRERRRPGQLDGDPSGEGREIQLDRLWGASEIGDAEHRFVFVLP